eukprot:TRINITY_DN44797_c0_g2_i1.p1 TRINITY_DN44797_c0_g2~~TRINITY_DN44797_c0_g2_i1.p1  ORF type:complete len:428 (+),score=97.98 TRINITY_DN44797_c0_g2_i1:115-1398(+)
MTSGKMQKSWSLPQLRGEQPVTIDHILTLPEFKTTKLGGRIFLSRRNTNILQAISKAHAAGDLPSLRSWIATVHRDAEDLAGRSVVTHAEMELAAASKWMVVCENAFSKFEPDSLTALFKGVRELEKLSFGPKFWQDPMHSKMSKIKAIVPYFDVLNYLRKQYRAGLKPFCAAWLAALESVELTPELEEVHRMRAECPPATVTETLEAMVTPAFNVLKTKRQDKIDNMNKTRCQWQAVYDASHVAPEPDACPGQKDEHTDWMKQVAKFRSKHGLASLSDAQHPYCQRRAAKGLSRTNRNTAIVDSVWEYICKLEGGDPQSDDAAKGKFVDVNSNLDLNNFGSARRVPLCTSSIIFSYELDEVIEPWLLIPSLGYVYDAPDIASMKATAAKDAVGEAICVPCVAEILLPLILFSGHFDDKLCARNGDA